MNYIPVERTGFPIQETGEGPSQSIRTQHGKCSPTGETSTTTMDNKPIRSYSTGTLSPMKAEPRYLEEETIIDYSRSVKDADSWKAIKRSGAIKMTPHTAGSITIKKFSPIIGQDVTPFGAASSSMIQYIDHRPPKCSTPEVRAVISPVGEVKGLSQTLYRSDIDHIFKDLPVLYDFRGALPNLSVAKNELMSSVVNEQRATYDILTEVGEFSETAKTVLAALEVAKRPMSALKQLVKEFKKKPSKTLANQWMQYRYAIMPIYYSINDALELLRERKDIYKTARSQQRLSMEFPERDMSVPHLYHDGSLSISLKATGKSRYSEQAQKLLAQTAFNPLITAWELTKFSWMVDWFVNVGDFIGAQAHMYTSMATEEAYCIAVQQQGVLETKLYIPDEWIYREVPWTHYSSDLKAIGFKPHSVTFNRGCDVVLQQEIYSTYERSLFNPGDVSLAFNPYLNWKRGLDALSLSSAKLSSSYRRLK